MITGPPADRQVLSTVQQAGAECGVDFEQFHPSRVLEEVRNRAALAFETEAAYAGRLADNRTEVDALRRAVLGNSALMYRDPATWQFLEEHLRRVWAGLGAEVQIRAWVPQCGSGEEAYTLAILLSELLGNPADLPRRLQIIATDTDETSLDHARLGRFPSSTLSALPESWKKQHFDLDRNLAEVHPRLRDCVVFARHDLFLDAPFTRMNLIVCREVLHYLVPEYQFSLVGCLYDSLEPGGVLLLGPDDDLARLQAIFRCESRARHVFSRPGLQEWATGPSRHVLSTYRPDGIHLVEAWVRASLALGIIVDSDDRVVEVVGRLEGSPWVEPASFDGRLATLIAPTLRAEVRKVIASALHEGRTSVAWIPTEPACLIRASAFDTVRGRMVGLAILDEPGPMPLADTTFDAGIDTLTGVLNRRGFLQQLTELLQADHRAGQAVLWIDIDGFSQINDVYGHDLGDAVLCVIAERLRSVCGRRGFVGRIGGDQFGIVINDGVHDQVPEDLAQAIRQELRKPILDVAAPIRLTASIGMVMIKGPAHVASAVLAAADRAMYAAKRAGGDRVHVSSPLHDDGTAERFHLRQQLADALHGDALFLHYQPIFDVRDRRLWGVEALLRWKHEGRVIPAGAFINAAQQTGQIREIGARVVDVIAADWPRLEDLLPESSRICMNLSVPEIEDVDLLGRLQSRLSGERLSRLVLEVTESAILGDERQAVSALELLRARGVRISMDDFGTGYSNLATLGKLAPDVLKADRSFLDMAVRGQGEKTHLLRTVRAIAGAFGADAVAEGVSSPTHLQVAVEAGYSLVQGFDVAMPSALNELSVVWR